MEKENPPNENQPNPTEPEPTSGSVNSEVPPSRGSFSAMIKEGERMTALEEKEAKEKKEARRLRRVKNSLTPEKAKRAIALTLEGKLAPQIAQDLDIKTRIFFNWISYNHEFRKKIYEARRQAAELYESKMLELAENTKRSNQVATNRFRFDAYNRLAKINDPDRYGDKVKHDGDGSGVRPIQIIFKTGVNREPEKEVKSIPIVDPDLDPQPPDAA